MAISRTMFQSDLSQPGGIVLAERSGSGLKALPSREIESVGANLLSIGLIGPHDQRRLEVFDALAGTQAALTKEYPRYPDLDEVQSMVEQNHDVVVIDLDSYPEHALDLVESICSKSQTTVMVYSAQANSDLMIRCMRAGAREFLIQPYTSTALAEALVRTSARRVAARPMKKTGGKVLVFFGAKGGSGVTTLATNYAITLARESGQKTLFIDLDLPLGDAALVLGITSQYSTVDALQNSARMDSNFLSKLLRNYSPQLSVLAAPGKFTKFEVSDDAIDRLIAVARQDFEYVVIDSGSRLDLVATTLFQEATTLFLVTQVSIPELRNSNRLISQFFSAESSKLEIVLNRYSPSMLGVDEEHITKALTMSARWKIPDDYATVLQMQNTATPLALDDSPISRAIRQMTRSVCGLTVVAEKKKKLSGLFG